MDQESYSSERISINDVRNSCETDLLWEEAGFIPPKKYFYFIELLHLSFLNGGNIVKADLLAGVSQNITKSVLQYNDSFFISDPEKMYRFAEEMKIEIENNGDTFIAARITAELIAEYMLLFNSHEFLKDERESYSSCNNSDESILIKGGGKY